VGKTPYITWVVTSHPKRIYWHSVKRW
jgi:hypothetical protein